MIFEIVPRGPQGPLGSSSFPTTGPDLAIIAFSHDLSSLDFKYIRFFKLGRLHALTHKGSADDGKRFSSDGRCIEEAERFYLT